MKKIVFGLSLVAVVFSLSGCGKNNPETAVVEKKVDPSIFSEKKDEGFVSGKLQDLLSLGKSLKCEVSYKDNASNAKSVSYVSGDEMKVEITATTDGQEFQSYMVIKDDWVYLWNDLDKKKGMKMKAEDPTSADSDELATEGGSMKTGLDQEVDFDCSAWTPEPFFFDLPTDVVFTDASSALEKMESEAGNIMSDPCTFCESMPDPTSKAECLKTCQ